MALIPAKSSQKQEAVTFGWLLIENEKYHMLDSMAICIHHTIIPIEKPGYSLRIYPKIWLPDVTLCHHFGTRTVQIELRDSQSKRESLQNPMKIDEEQLNIVTQ